MENTTTPSNGKIYLQEGTNTREITESELSELKSNSSVKLKEVEANTYKKLDKMFG